MSVRHAALTHPGRRHELNEDCVVGREDLGLWMVADGMGGHAAGEVASRIAQEVIPAAIEDGKDLVKAALLAHERILEAATETRSQAGMGTTLVALHLDGAFAQVVWVGDSRAYLWRRGTLMQLSRDHSFMQMLIDRQQITEEEARAHPRRNIVTQVLGVETPVPEELRLPLKQGDWLLLCSDGLSDELSEDDIVDMLADAPSVEAAATRLVDGACLAGGRDNVSAVVVAYDGEDATEVATIARQKTDGDTTEFPQVTPRQWWQKPWPWAVGGLLLAGLLTLAVIGG